MSKKNNGASNALVQGSILAVASIISRIICAPREEHRARPGDDVVERPDAAAPGRRRNAHP